MPRTNVDMDTQTLASSAGLCLESFERCISKTKERKEENEIEIGDYLDTECGRFRIWARNIGVFAGNHASLDYRLRDSPVVKDLLLGQLYIIRKHLTRGKIITQNLKDLEEELMRAETQRDYDLVQIQNGAIEDDSASDDNIADDESDSESSISSTSEPSEGMPVNGAGDLAPIKDAIGRLHRLSVAIRKPALMTQNSRVAKHKELNEEGQDIFDIFEKYVASRIVEVNCPDSTVIIQRRLSKAMAFRRRRFHYRQRHQVKLSGRKAVVPRRLHLSAGNASGYSTPWTARSTDFNPPKLTDRFAKVASLGKAESILSATTASRFEESRFRPDIPSTKASSFFSGIGSQNHKLDILPPPKIPEGAAEFSCPHCCLVLPVDEAKPKAWRQHIMRDLEPYVCLIEHCPDPEHFFRDRGTWFSHMRTHSTEWRCSLLNHSLSFKCEDDYDKHMRDEHSSQFTVKQLDKLRMRSRHERPGSSPFASCPLCSWDPSMGHSGKAPVPKPHGFTNVCSTVTEHSRLLLEHIANHLQFLALYCLTAQDDVDEVLSSDEPSLRRAKSSTLRTSDTHLSGWVDEDIGVSESSHPTDPHMDIFEEPAAIPIADMTSADDWNFVYQSRAAYTGHENDAKLQNFIRKAKMEALLAEGKTADPILPCRSIPLQRNPGFFGRETILYKMETALCPGERLPGSTSTQKGVNSLILQGEGGVGKTQIAVEFAYSNRDSFDVVLWAHADEPSKLARDFNRMAIKLGLVSENSAEARDHLFTRDLLKAWLMQPLKSYETPGKAEGASWLLIFDHVIWPDVLNDYWPIGGSTGSILITTRRTMPWSTVKYPVCPIEPFPEEEAAAFLKKEVKQRGCSHDEEHARLLARRVNGFPHELSLLSRIIVNNNNSLCQFLKEYDKKQSQREILRLNVQDLAASVRDDFFSGWALEVLDAKSAALLDVLSMLDPDAVPEELLAATPKHIYIENYPDSRPSYEETRNILLSNSLVSRDRATGNLIQHRLIQDATRRQMDRDRIRLVFNACVQLINAVWPWQEFTFRHSIRRWPKCELLFPHIIRLRKWGKQIDAQISDLSGAYEYARLLSDAGWHYHEIGRSLESEGFLDVAERICTDLLKFYPLNYTIETDESPTEGQVNDIMAEIYHTRGCIAAEMNRPEEALTQHIAFNDMMVKQFGDGPLGNDMRLGISWSQLGAAYMVNDNWTKGEECFTKAIRVMKRLDDFQHYKITLPIVNLGLAYWLTGRNDEALKTLQKGLEHRKIAFGLNDKESFITGRFYHALGNVKASQGQLDEAFELHHKARDHYRLTLGKGHHRTADTCIKISDHYARTGEPEQALELFEQAIGVYQDRKIYSPEKARALYKRSTVYTSVGKLADAACDGGEALRLYRLSKPYDTRPLNELEDSDFDSIIVFWSR